MWSTAVVCGLVALCPGNMLVWSTAVVYGLLYVQATCWCGPQLLYMDCFMSRQHAGVVHSCCIWIALCPGNMLVWSTAVVYGLLYVQATCWCGPQLLYMDCFMSRQHVGVVHSCCIWIALCPGNMLVWSTAVVYGLRYVQATCWCGPQLLYMDCFMSRQHAGVVHSCCIWIALCPGNMLVWLHSCCIWIALCPGNMLVWSTAVVYGLLYVQATCWCGPQLLYMDCFMSRQHVGVVHSCCIWIALCPGNMLVWSTAVVYGLRYVQATCWCGPQLLVGCFMSRQHAGVVHSCCIWIALCPGNMLVWSTAVGWLLYVQATCWCGPQLLYMDCVMSRQHVGVVHSCCLLVDCFMSRQHVGVAPQLSSVGCFMSRQHVGVAPQLLSVDCNMLVRLHSCCLWTALCPGNMLVWLHSCCLWIALCPGNMLVWSTAVVCGLQHAGEALRLLSVDCFTSQQHANVSQGRVCSDNCTCCHAETEVADQTFYLTQSQYADTRPTTPSTDPITPGAWQGSHWRANF